MYSHLHFTLYKSLDSNEVSLFLCVADPDSEINVMEANERFMDQSEELYSALMGCFCQPPESWDGVTCSVTCYLPEPIYQYEEMD